MGNVIRRRTQSAVFEALLDSNVWKTGDVIKAVKKNGAWTGKNASTGQTFKLPIYHMRNENLLKLVLQWDYA